MLNAWRQQYFGRTYNVYLVFMHIYFHNNKFRFYMSINFSQERIFIQSSLNFHNPFKFAIHQLYYKTFYWISTSRFIRKYLTYALYFSIFDFIKESDLLFVTEAMRFSFESLFFGYFDRSFQWNNCLIYILWYNLFTGSTTWGKAFFFFLTSKLKLRTVTTNSQYWKCMQKKIICISNFIWKI